MVKFFTAKLKTPKYLLIVLGFLIFAGIAGGNRISFASSADDLKESLRQQMEELQKQIDEYRSNINNLQQQGKSLKQEINLFDNKIKAATLEIKRNNLAIQQTESEIENKNTALAEAEKKLDREKEIIAENLQAISEQDEQGLLEMILRNQKLSDIFEEINSLQTIQEGVQESMVEISQLKTTLENDRQVLEDKKDELNQLKVLQQIQKQTLAAQQGEKKDLLTQTKGQESNFQKLLEKAKQDAASIRSNLYLLEGVGVSMPLEKAYQYAQKVNTLTGVRPAFLLAVLKKETSWGVNLGSGNWRRDMKPTEQKAFLQICDELGKNPDTTPVSAKPWYGWGGAMGPAQFLPTTWLAYEQRIAQLTGHHPPDPWDIEDAFTAAGIKLAQGGANTRVREAEWKAAQVYFAGSRWNNPTYYFYGDQVMELADVIQEQLNIIAR